MKKRFMVFGLILTLILQLSTGLLTVFAADGDSGITYYVSTLNGNDSNDGKSKLKAFYSLQKINDITLQPGDKVLLEAGSVFVDGYLHLKGSGSQGNPILVDKYGEGNRPIIATNGKGIWYQDYGKPLDSSSHKLKGDVSSCILLYDVEYVEISNIEMTNNTGVPDSEYSALNRMDRTGVAAVAQDKGTVSHIVLKNLYVHDILGNVYNKHMNNGGIYFTVFKPHNEAVTGISRYDDVLIESCKVEQVSRWGIAVGYTAYWDKFTAAVIPDAIGETYGSTNVVIRNCYVKEPGGDSITTMYCHRPLVEYNVSEGAAREINPTIYNATGSGRVAAAIWPWKCKDAVFQYNEAYDTYLNQDGQAWDADYGDGVFYQYNYSHNNGGGCVMVCGGQAINTIFRYNISQNDLAGVLNIPGNPIAYFYNNVFYMKEGVPFIRTSMRGGTAVVENNIIYNAGASKTEDWQSGSKVTYSNNLYYNYSNTPVSDIKAITADPKFVAAGTAPSTTNGTAYNLNSFAGYKLQMDSPAINAGKIISNNGGLDFYGRPLVTTPDIGVYETGNDVPNNDSSLHTDSILYMIEQVGGVTTLLVPSLDKTPTTAAELLGNIVIDSEASAKLIKDGVQVNPQAAVTEGMSLEITAEDGSKTSYPIKIKNVYKYASDFVANVQGNVWFSQEKVSGSYKNMTTYNTGWACWTGSLYSSVGLSSTTSGLGLLCNQGNQGEQSHSIAFRAPKSGTVELSFRDPVVLRNLNNAGTVTVAVTVNGEIKDGPYTIPNNKTSITIAKKEYVLNKGDYLRIEAINSGSVNSSSFTINPEVTYIKSENNEEPSRIALDAAIAAAEVKYDAAVVGTEAGQYPQSAKNALLAALNAAKAVIDNAASTQEDIDLAVTALNSAVTTFEEQVVLPVNKEALNTAIAAAEKKYDAAVVGTEAGQYPQSAKDALLAALNAAKAVKDNAASTQEDIDLAVTALNSAVTTFERQVISLVNKEALNTAVTAAEEKYAEVIAGTEYTKTEKYSLLAAINVAKAVSKNTSSTETNIAAALKALNSVLGRFN